MTGKTLARLVLGFALLGAIAFTLLHLGHWDASALERSLRGAGPWAPILFVALYALATVLFVPGSLFSLAGGALFGPIWGSVLNLTGATIGATLDFLIARYLAGDWVRHRAGARLNAIVEGVEAEGWRFVALVRLVPLFPFNLVNYAFGLTRIPLGAYVLASVVCMIPGTIAYTWLGHAGREIATGSRTALRSALWALGLLAAITLLARLIRRLRMKASEAPD